LRETLDVCVRECACDKEIESGREKVSRMRETETKLVREREWEKVSRVCVCV
jgi:hypothetical protein